MNLGLFDMQCINSHSYHLNLTELRVNKLNENMEQLLQEAISISSQRSNRNQEIPHDLQQRMGYILSKLNMGVVTQTGKMRHQKSRKE
jgi:hypothetical protein